ncbi:MAG TPA: helix-turn-helix transcriptional regulator [Opitutaceae bacterium]|nr:helix-turn-helix transcriptional regulator [Opitutaceae bacterium]
MKKQLMTLHMLDRLSADLSGLRAQNIPEWGWLWTVRKAIGLSAREVAGGREISRQSIAAFERGEAKGTIQLGKLASVADVMGCQLVYTVSSFRPEILQRIKEVTDRRGGPPKVSDKEPPTPKYLEKSGMPSGGWLKRMRLSLGYSRAEVAAKVGVAPTTLRDLERSEAKGTITLNSLRRVATALDCEVIYFLNNNGSVAPSFLNRMIPSPAEKKVASDSGKMMSDE